MRDACKIPDAESAHRRTLSCGQRLADISAPAGNLPGRHFGLSLKNPRHPRT
ncbi:MAG: hypothetical protein OJF61_000138 [Rhodanobacteraceae bacterium]|jgi:hypothetical protein|nr:MAG: hypothetical protein OJF61_000138 [Rhodanobacteraceae bacterium]